MAVPVVAALFVMPVYLWIFYICYAAVLGLILKRQRRANGAESERLVEQVGSGDMTPDEAYRTASERLAKSRRGYLRLSLA